MKEHKINYWIYPGLTYNIYDTKTAMKAVTQIFNVTSKELKSKSRKRYITEARFAYCYITRKKLYYTLDIIGKSINRHHATVIHNVNMAKILGEQNTIIKHKIDILNANINKSKIER
jgi:chromosomal replication initiator protein